MIDKYSPDQLNTIEELHIPSTNNTKKTDKIILKIDNIQNDYQGIISHKSEISQTNDECLDKIEKIEKIEIDTIEKKDDTQLLEERRHSYVGHLDDAPKFSKDNEYILHGYRINFHTCETIVGSLCLCHNETVNVWTHLVGALFTVILMIITGITNGPYSSKINEPWRAKINSINFQNYSVPFYSSIPMFHNTRIYLTYMNLNIQKTFNLTNNYNLNAVDTKLIEIFLDRSLIDYSGLFSTLNLIDDNSIQCVSCIEDFVRNLYTVKDFLNITIDYVDRITSIDIETIRLIEKIKSFNDIIAKIIVQMSDKTSNLKILNGNYHISDYGRYGYSIESFYSNVALVKWPIYLQLVGAIICLSCSSTYHLFTAYSHKVVEVLARLDYAGISVLIAGSCFPAYYYFFYCDLIFRSVYLSFISGFAFIVFLFSLTPSFNKPEKRKLRGWLFLLLGISTAVPIFHLTFFFDEKIGMMADSQLLLWSIGGGVYIFGCLIYIFRFPERFFPGKFDLIGSSHQIWHIFVLGGIILHHFASLNTYFDRLNHECPS